MRWDAKYCYEKDVGLTAKYYRITISPFDSI
jgi:hypothetical protein